MGDGIFSSVRFIRPGKFSDSFGRRVIGCLRNQPRVKLTRVITLVYRHIVITVVIYTAFVVFHFNYHYRRYSR